MAKSRNPIKILLCEGLTDGLARASNAAEVLKKTSSDYTFAYTKEYIQRNRIDHETLSVGLGLSSKGIQQLSEDWRDTHELISISQCMEINSLTKDNPNTNFIVNTDTAPLFWEESRSILGQAGKATYQRYSSEFEKVIRSGSILKKAERPPEANKLFIHYRLGDIALLSCKDLAKIYNIEKSFHSFWISPLRSELLTFDKIIDMAGIKGIKGTRIILKKFIPHQIYEDFIKNQSTQFQSIHFSSDGFMRSAITAKELLKIRDSVKSIEEKLESYYLSKIKSMSTSYSIGENTGAIEATLTQCATASHWQMGGSAFPFDLFQKCGIKRSFCSPPLTDHPSRIHKIFEGRL